MRSDGDHGLIADKEGPHPLVACGHFEFGAAELLNLEAVIILGAVDVGDIAGREIDVGIAQVGIFGQRKAEIKAAQLVDFNQPVAELVALRIHHLVLDRDIIGCFAGQQHIALLFRTNPA